MDMKLCEVEAPSGFYDWVDTQIAIPFIGGVQAQGDVLVVPSASVDRRWNGTGGTDGGHCAVRKRRSRPHACRGGRYDVCRIRFDKTGDPNVIARVECDGAPVVLTHMEHGGNGILAGTYEFRRQVEWDGVEERRVAD
jgi:hypothetical protein